MIDRRPLAALAEIAGAGWLVGGAVRDRLLGRETSDYDVALPGPVRDAALALGAAAGGHAFELSHAFGAWRVVAHDRRWQVDLMPIGGEGIETDLARRDLTINAIAQPLSGGSCVDPFGGVQDLRRRRLRMVGADAFQRDPLRAVRLARLACELGFEVDPQTTAAARSSAPALTGVAPERIFAELVRVICAPAALDGLAVMDATGVTDAVIPELAALRGVQQNRFHHLDVADHSREVLAQVIELERDPGRLGADDAVTAALRGLLEVPLANDLTRWQALRFGALMHDIAKPQTRAVTADGRVTFLHHDVVGAELSSAVLGRLRASERLRSHVAKLTRNHLRLGFLVHEAPLPRRAVYDYLHACDPVGVDVTLLSVADRLATRGESSEPAIARHMAVARPMLAEALAWERRPPRPPLRGDELARALGIRPGPVVGGLLAELEAASFSGELATREEAIARARQLIEDRG